MKLFKNAGAVLLCAVMAVSMLLPLTAGAAETENGQETLKGTGQIRLSVGEGQETPVFKAGEKAELKISITNRGSEAARDVTVVPVIQNAEKWPFEMDKLNYEQNIGTLEANARNTIVWGSGDDKLKVREDVTGKYYQLTFRICYNDGGNEYKMKKSVFVKTAARENTAGQGQDSADPAPQMPQTPPMPQAPQSSAGGGSAEMDNSGISGTGEMQGAGMVFNPEPSAAGDGSGSSGNGSVPRVIVTGFDTEPGGVKAGTNFKLVVHLQNTSKRTAVSNMLFDFQAPSAGTEAAAEAPAFLPVSGSSTVYLENIPAGGTKDIAIDLNARADLVQKPYSISLNMKYEDSSAAQYEGQSSLAIPVRQEARFEFSKIQLSPDTAVVGDEVNITCSLYNLGRVRMYNVKVKFEGEAIEGQELFLGNLDSGSTGMIDGIVTAVDSAYDDSNCRMIISYEDDAGNVMTAEQKFTITVNPQEEFTDAGMIDETEDAGSSPLPGILAAAAAVIVIGSILAAVLIRRKKKRIAAEEEELEDEVERLTEDQHQQP